MQVKRHSWADFFYGDHQTVMMMGKECTRETTVLCRIYNAGLSEWSEKVTEVNSYTAIREEKCGNIYM